jgi:hypothetical protein
MCVKWQEQDTFDPHTDLPSAFSISCTEETSEYHFSFLLTFLKASKDQLEGKKFVCKHACNVVHKDGQVGLLQSDNIDIHFTREFYACDASQA